MEITPNNRLWWSKGRKTAFIVLMTLYPIMIVLFIITPAHPTAIIGSILMYISVTLHYINATRTERVMRYIISETGISMTFGRVKKPLEIPFNMIVSLTQIKPGVVEIIHTREDRKANNIKKVLFYLTDAEAFISAITKRRDASVIHTNEV